jgi:hypothetical protein
MISKKLTRSWVIISLTAILLFATVGLPMLLFGQGGIGNMGNRGFSARGNFGGQALPPVIPNAIPADVRIRQDDCWVEMSVHVRNGDYTVERVIWYIEPGTQVELVYNWRLRRWEGSICLQSGVYRYHFQIHTDDGLIWLAPQEGNWTAEVR